MTCPGCGAPDDQGCFKGCTEMLREAGAAYRQGKEDAKRLLAPMHMWPPRDAQEWACPICRADVLFYGHTDKCLLKGLQPTAGVEKVTGATSGGRRIRLRGDD